MYSNVTVSNLNNLQIVAKYTGDFTADQTALNKTVLNKIDDSKISIKSRYSSLKFFNEALPSEERTKIIGKCLRINATKFLKATGACAVVGTLILGLTIGGILGNGPGAVTGGTMGLKIGTTVGFSCSYQSGYLSTENDKYFQFSIEKHPKFKNFQDQIVEKRIPALCQFS